MAAMPENQLLAELSWKALLDAIPIPSFLVDDDVRILAHNSAAEPMLNGPKDTSIRLKTGEALNCTHSSETPEGCGGSDACKNCLVRGTVSLAAGARTMVRRRARMDLVRAGVASAKLLLVSAAPIATTSKPVVLLMFEDLGVLTEELAVVPVCAWCKKLMTPDKVWQSVESFFSKRLEVDLSHSMCPECRKHYFGSLDE